MDIAQIYAKYAKDLNFDDLPQEVVDHSKKLILDIMGNDIGGYEWMDSGPSIVNGIREINRGNSGSTVIATGESMAPEWASFPTHSGRSAYGQPVKSHAELASFYSKNLQKLRQGA